MVNGPAIEIFDAEFGCGCDADDAAVAFDDGFRLAHNGELNKSGITADAERQRYHAWQSGSLIKHTVEPQMADNERIDFLARRLHQLAAQWRKWIGAALWGLVVARRKQCRNRQQK